MVYRRQHALCTSETTPRRTVQLTWPRYIVQHVNRVHRGHAARFGPMYLPHPPCSCTAGPRQAAAGSHTAQYSLTCFPASAAVAGIAPFHSQQYSCSRSTPRTAPEWPPQAIQPQHAASEPLAAPSSFARGQDFDTVRFERCPDRSYAS